LNGLFFFFFFFFVLNTAKRVEYSVCVVAVLCTKEKFTWFLSFSFTMIVLEIN
jgi:hypothetical protein